MKKKIVVLPGDGIGKEVTTEGRKALKTIAENFEHEFLFEEAIIGHEAIEQTGSALPVWPDRDCRKQGWLLCD